MLKEVLVTLSLLSYYFVVSSLDVDAIVNGAFDDYYRTVNASGSLQVGCKPKIIKNGPNGSKIGAIHNYGASVQLIVYYGTCPVNYIGYMCSVNWGDGKEKTYNKTDHLLQCHMTYHYEDQTENTYMIHAMYCSLPGSQLGADECTSMTCDSYVIPVSVTKDPVNPKNL